MELLPGGALPPNSLVLAAHPDDEVVGAAVLIARSPTCGIVHVTDGAPRDTRFWARSFRGNRDEYARVRRAEAEEALALAGVPKTRIHCLSGVDQDAAREIPRLARELALLLRRLRPPVLVLQAYEGGHPDHDAAAAIGRAAALLLSRAHEQEPVLVEMTGYHARDGGLVVGEFLDPGHDVVRVDPSLAEVTLKQRMLDAHRSQAETLAPFRVGPELFRPAPPTDFSRPPHAGELYAERMGWMSGEEFRSLARAALTELGLPHTLG
jgi:LmbE family N-acetylglucosaminyl deacetylase